MVTGSAARPTMHEFMSGRNVLDVILFNAGQYIPLQQEDVLAELANASVEYATGQEGKLGYGGPEDLGFEARVHKYFKLALRDAKQGFTWRVGKAIEWLLDYTLPSGNGDCAEANMYAIFKAIKNRGTWFEDEPNEETPDEEPNGKVFGLSETTRSKIEYQVMFQFYTEELIELKEIGKLMQKYITRDLAAVERQRIRNI